MDLKIVKIVDKTKEKYVAKNGKEYTSVNYYVVFNGTYIAIRPTFKDGYTKLDLVSEEIVKDNA